MYGVISTALQAIESTNKDDAKNHLWKGSKSSVKKSLVEKSPVERVKTSILEPHHKSWIAPLHGRAGKSFIIKMLIMK